MKTSQSNLLTALREGGAPVGTMHESVKVVTEKYVDSPEEAKRVAENKPPAMTLGRAKRLIDQGMHMHNETEYVHQLTKTTGCKKIHGMWHCAVTPDTLKDVMKNATFDTGEYSY